jgi:hypothetical protein
MTHIVLTRLVTHGIKRKNPDKAPGFKFITGMKMMKLMIIEKMKMTKEKAIGKTRMNKLRA